MTEIICGMCRHKREVASPTAKWCSDCQHAYDHGRERGAGDERKKVVREIRQAAQDYIGIRQALTIVADRIEAKWSGKP
jgi:hypothetical protein